MNLRGENYYSKKYPLREQFNDWLAVNYETLSYHSVMYAMMYSAYAAGLESKQNES